MAKPARIEHRDDPAIRIELAPLRGQHGLGQRPQVRLGEVDIQHGLFDALCPIHCMSFHGFAPNIAARATTTTHLPRRMCSRRSRQKPPRRAPGDHSDAVRGAERLRAWHEGFSLHAGVVIAEHDRDALERLCRYGARPAFAQERLSWTDDGRIAYKRPWPDGRTALVMPPVAFLRRLCGIIPPPRRHLVTYSGIFGPAAKDRAKLRALVPECGDAAAPPCSPTTAAPHMRAGRLPWADLLRRVFADDVLQCACGGRRSVIAVVTDPTVARTLLVALRLCSDSEPATFAPARDPPQAEFAWDDPA